MGIYAEFSWKMSQDTFQAFVKPENYAAQLLQSHLIAMQTLLAPVTDNENQKPANASKKSQHKTVMWIGCLHNNIPPHMRLFNEWPLSIMELWNRGASKN
jgi:hypothetical protein